jgi:hypothetical protein
MHMPKKIPDEVVVARLSIEAARTALESLFERMRVMPRAEKVIVTETVHEACLRLQAAQALLTGLETTAPGDDADDEQAAKA